MSTTARFTGAATALALSAGLLAGTAASASAVTPRPTTYEVDADEAAGHPTYFRLDMASGGAVRQWRAQSECDDTARATLRRLRAVDGRIAGASSYEAPDGTRRTLRMSLRVVDRDLMVGSVRWLSCGATRVDQVVLGTTRAWDADRSSAADAELVLAGARRVEVAMEAFHDRFGRYPTSLRSARFTARKYGAFQESAAARITTYTPTAGGASYALRVTSERVRVLAKLSSGGTPVLAVR